MDAERMTKDREHPRACTACGGTGCEGEDEFYGPFLVNLPQRLRAAVREHIHDRHQVLEAVDRHIAKYMLGLLEKPEDLTQQLLDMQAALDATVVKWMDGDRGEALRKIFLLIGSAVWLLESVGFNDQLTPEEE